MREWKRRLRLTDQKKIIMLQFFFVFFFSLLLSFSYVRTLFFFLFKYSITLLFIIRLPPAYNLNNIYTRKLLYYTRESWICCLGKFVLVCKYIRSFNLESWWHYWGLRLRSYFNQTVKFHGLYCAHITHESHVMVLACHSFIAATNSTWNS